LADLGNSTNPRQPGKPFFTNRTDQDQDKDIAKTCYKKQWCRAAVKKKEIALIAFRQTF
jgi:hypothetical protein